MFDIGAPELFIVAVLAIIVVGPKDLPKLIRSVMGMIRKVRDMGSEFQAGVKKMADEVELDAITRKLNEAGNISIDDVKPDIDPGAEFSDYEEFDYEEFDYDKKTDKKEDDAKNETETVTEATPQEAVPTEKVTKEIKEEITVEPVEAAEISEDKTKSNSDG